MHKTVNEVAVERSLNRSTLLKAAQRSRQRDGCAAWAYQSGATWLVDDESEAFKAWLAGTSKGRPRKPLA